MTGVTTNKWKVPAAGGSNPSVAAVPSAFTAAARIQSMGLVPGVDSLRRVERSLPALDGLPDMLLCLFLPWCLCMLALGSVTPVVVERPRKEKATALFNFIPQVRRVVRHALLDSSQQFTHALSLSCRCALQDSATQLKLTKGDDVEVVRKVRLLLQCCREFVPLTALVGCDDFTMCRDLSR